MKKIAVLLIAIILLSTLVSCSGFNNLLGKNYKITYDTNKMVKISAEYVDMGEIPEIPDAPTVEGYVFAGWYLDEAFTERYYFDYPLDKNTTLYANFYDTKLGEYMVISTYEQLVAIKDAPDAKYLLACDINCHGEAITPIDEFSGELNGNGYELYDFAISDTALISGFIRTNNGIIKDLALKDFVMDILVNVAADKNCGSLCGINNGIIDNCDVIDGAFRINDTFHTGNASVVGQSLFGGIAGCNNGSIIDCSTIMNIDASFTSSCWENKVTSSTYATSLYFHIGGIVGWSSINGKIDECTNQAEISVYMNTAAYDDTAHAYSFGRIGGVAGGNEGDINNCVNTGNIDERVEAMSAREYT